MLYQCQNVPLWIVDRLAHSHPALMQIHLKCSCSFTPLRGLACESLQEYKLQLFVCELVNILTSIPYKGSMSTRLKRLKCKVMLSSYEKVVINGVVKDKLQIDFILQHLTYGLNSVIWKKKHSRLFLIYFYSKGNHIH